MCRPTPVTAGGWNARRMLHDPSIAESALSVLGLGCSRIGAFNNPQPSRESCALIHAALALGVTTIDTANVYGQGDSEALIGRALQGRRDDAFVITKAGHRFSAKVRLLKPFKPILLRLLGARHRNAGAVKAATTPPHAVTARRGHELRTDWRPEALRASLEGSLRRLRTDRVDGFLLHGPPPDVAKDPAVHQALASLKKAGKARHFGVSCDDRMGLEAALTMPGLTLLQLPWTLIEEVAGTPLDDAIRRRKATVLAREVIRLQPHREPTDAVRNAARNPLVTTTLVGTLSQLHLGALQAALTSARRPF